MAEPSVLRLVTLRPVESDSVVDSALRRLVNGPLSSLALDGFIVGRRHEHAGERVVVSAWASEADMLAALGPEASVGPAPAERLDDAAELIVVRLPIAIGLTFERATSPTILRVYRGRTRPGELGAYVDDVREGTLTDVAAGHGPLALYMAVEEPDRFTTVSAWESWDPIELATGGDVRNPLATRHSHRLVDGTADYYEILPNVTGESLPAPVPT